MQSFSSNNNVGDSLTSSFVILRFEFRSLFIASISSFSLFSFLFELSLFSSFISFISFSSFGISSSFFSSCFSSFFGFSSISSFCSFSSFLSLFSAFNSNLKLFIIKNMTYFLHYLNLILYYCFHYQQIHYLLS